MDPESIRSSGYVPDDGKCPKDGNPESNEFKYEHFIWEGNVNFIHYAGSWAVPIKYNIDDDDLYELLDSINGVLFTGGAMPLINMETGY